MKSEYKHIAKYYDSINTTKDYKSDSEKIRVWIREYKTSRGREMLDAACGTGNHIQYMKRYFNITGLDLDPYMLRMARSKYPDIKFIRDDMRTFQMNNQFDVIVCLFSAIGHLKTYKNLSKAIINFSRHLKQGGVLFIESFITENRFIPGYLAADFVNGPNLKIARLAVSKKKNNIMYIDFRFLVGEKGKIRYFTERMQIAMFDNRRVLNIMKKAGLRAKCIKNGLMEARDLYIGVKP